MPAPTQNPCQHEQHGFARVAAVSPELKLGDVSANVAILTQEMRRLAGQGCRLILFPELCLTGYSCADLFHFDVPWNPSRLEQRNGRIDRKLQRSDEVRCHYFVYSQRPEDRVLKALVVKSKTIREQLGSLAPVLELHLV